MRLSSAAKILILFFLFEIMALSRVYLEVVVLTSNLRYFVFLHRFFWYTFVFLWFMACFRHILKISLDKTAFLSLYGIILYIPPAYAYLFNQPFMTNYFYSEDIAEITKELLTLHYGHSQNYLMFPELLLLLTGTILVSWFLSKSVVKTAINTIVAFYASFVIAGFSIFAVETKHPGYIRLQSAFYAQQFYTMIFFGMSVMMLIIIFLPEIRRNIFPVFMKPKAFLLFFAILIAEYLFLILVIMPLYTRQQGGIEFVLAFFPFLCIAVMPFISMEKTLPIPAKVFSAYLAVLSILIIAGSFFARGNSSTG